MKNKKGVWMRIVFLSILFIGAILVCTQDRMTAQAKSLEALSNVGESLPLAEDERMVISQADNQPPSWIGPKQADPAGGALPPPPRPTKVPAVPTPQQPPVAGPVTPLAPAPATPPTSATPAPATTPPPSPPPAPSPSRGSGFIFNFDNADLYEVIRVMGEVLKLSYIIDPKVKGVVNIHTSGQISSDDVFSIFQSILLLNGATAVKKGQLYEIVPFGDAKKLYTLPSRIEDSGKSLLEEKYVIQIIPLKFIPVAEVSKMIKPFLSDGADIIEHPSQNILLVGDIASNIRKVVDLIGLFDIDLFTDLRVRIYPIYNSDVTEIAKEMERIFASFEVSTKSGRGVGITFTAVTRVNSLLVVSAIPNIFEKVEGWLKQLDQTPSSDAKTGVFVYYVQNSKAKDIAEVLKQVFTSPKSKTTSSTTSTTSTPSTTTPATPPGSRGVRPTSPTAAPGAPPPTEEGGVPAGEINIVVDETTNALIVRAYPRDYKLVLETVKKLDLYPKQVLIEVFLANITLDDTTKFGIEFSVFQDTFTKNGNLYKWTLGMGGLAAADPTQFVSGIRYAIVAADKLAAAVNALANDNKAKIIASPHLLASNNKEAKIQIGTSQPILTNTYTTSATGTATSVVEGSIEYRDVGIIITVTPRISDGGLVTMDISVESSDVSQTTLGSLSNVPVFSKKTAKTTLSISDAQTIVIGGLIQESKSDNKSGVPFLSRIPILGGLFGYQNYQKNRQELMLLLTPHVITDLDQSNAVTREFKQKLDSLRRDIDMPAK